MASAISFASSRVGGNAHLEVWAVGKSFRWEDTQARMTKLLGNVQRMVLVLHEGDAAVKQANGC